MRILDRIIPIIGAASGQSANQLGCEKAPALIESLLRAGSKSSQEKSADWSRFMWQETITCTTSLRQLAALPAVADFCLQLATFTQKLATQYPQLLVMGGDHAVAMGTWSGIVQAYAPRGPLGLIWVDAHLDSHTPDDTESGNIHGMPLASLLGQGDVLLTQILSPKPKFKPQHVVVIGARSYEPVEVERLQSLGVRVYWMRDIERLGIAAIFTEAVEYLTATTVGIGMSIDLDAFDPHDVPAVSAPEPHGIFLGSFLAATNVLKSLVALEITEFNPTLPGSEQTAQAVLQLMNRLL